MTGEAARSRELIAGVASAFFASLELCRYFKSCGAHSADVTIPTSTTYDATPRTEKTVVTHASRVVKGTMS